MNPVPYALNQVLLYGDVVGVEQEMSEKGVFVTLLLRTHRAEEPHPVELRDRRALELLAYHQVHREMYPRESFLVSVTGSLITRQRTMTVAGDSITFHIPPDVRTWGSQAVRLAFKRYVDLYGDRPWLHINSGAHDLDPEPGPAPEKTPTPVPSARRRAHAKVSK